MSDIILPSKLITERITASFDFLDELDWAETIISATTAIITVSGVDGSPDLIKYKTPTITGSVVAQQLYKGLPGVIYKVICTAVGSTGRIYSKSANLAILPDTAIIPLILGTVFTSEIYPIEDIVTYISGLALTSGSLLGELMQDNILNSLDLISGNLFGGSVLNTADPESIDSSLVIQSGNLFGGAVFNTATPDGIDSTFIILSGNLYGNAVFHTQPADAYISSLDIVSGTLI